MKDKKKLDIVKLKGIFGLFLIISLLVLGKLAKFYEISSEMRNWMGMSLLFLGGFGVWLMQDWLKRLLGQDK